MARITRKLQKIFALGASNNGQFGSGKTGAKVTSSDLDTIQALSAWNTGWLDAIISAEDLPPLEEMQSTNYVNTTQLAYLFQEGIPEWETGTTYYQYSIVKKTNTYELYASLTNSNQGNALTDDTNWVFLQNLQPDISITMGFESSPTGRKLIFNGSTFAKTSGGTVNGSKYVRAYDYLWANVSNTYAPVSGGRGASSAADWAANKTITIPDFTNMSPMQVGSIVNSAGKNTIGASTVTSTGSVSGSVGTSGAYTLSTGEIPAHTHSITTRRDSPGTDDFIFEDYSSANAGSKDTNSTGGGGSHSHSGGSLSASYTGNATSVVQPVFGLYYYINY